MRVEKVRFAATTFLMAAALVLCCGLRAYAFDPSGWWQSANGSRVYIAAGRNEVSITIESADGRSSAYRGRWLQPPESFEYFTPQRGWRRVVSDGRNPNVLHVFSQDHRDVDWVRLEDEEPRPRHRDRNPGWGYPPMEPPRQEGPSHDPSRNDYVSSQPASVEGVWRTESGDTFHVSTKGNHVSVTIIDPLGKRTAANGWWLVEGARFAYSLLDKPGVTQCELDPLDPARMRASKNGRVILWEKTR